MNGENYIVKANKLIEAKGRMTALEQKLFSTLVSEIQPNDKDFKEYEFSIKNFIDLTGSNDNKIYMDIHNSARRLMNKIITIETDKTVMTTALLSSVETPKGEGVVKMTFHPFLKPYLLDIKERFTQYQLKNILTLKGTHSIRIYELLKQYENIGKREFELLEFKTILGLQNEYDRVFDFEKYVLKTSKEEINEYTDITIDYEKIKRGRKIVGVKFTIKSKIHHDENKIIDALYTKEEIKNIQEKSGLQNEKFNSKQIMDLYEIAVTKTDSNDLNPFEYIRLNYLQMIKKENIKNKFAYLKKFLENDWANAIKQLKFDCVV